MKLLKKISGFFLKLTPKMEVAGLWITEGLVSFYSPGKGEKDNQISLRLPPGVVANGRVQNHEALVKVLRELFKRTSAGPKRAQNVVLSVPITHIHIQPFALPAVAAGSLAESAGLNMRMISPINIDDAYYDWQRISAEEADQVEVVGAFVPKSVMEGFITSAQEAGYGVAVAEFSTLSSVRAALQAKIIDDQKPYLFLEVGSAGINFSVSHAGHLFFHQFVSWEIFRDGQRHISIDKFKEGLVDEIRKIINFYTTNRKGQEVQDVILASSSYVNEMKSVISGQFPAMEVKTVDPKSINPVVGAALRGLMSRSKDTGISLNSLTALEVFAKNQLANFVAVWRNVLVAVFGFLLLIFLSSAIILQRTAAQMAASDPFGAGAGSGEELRTLEERAIEFNNLVAIVSGLRADRKEMAPVIQEFDKLAGSDISIDRLSIQVDAMTATIAGVGKNRERVTDFKNTLEEHPNFSNVRLPLSDIRTDGGEAASFSLSLQIDSLDF